MPAVGNRLFNTEPLYRVTFSHVIYFGDPLKITDKSPPANFTTKPVLLIPPPHPHPTPSFVAGDRLRFKLLRAAADLHLHPVPLLPSP